MKYILLILFVGIVACSAARTYSSKEERMYYEKCIGCHRAHDKSEFSSEEWSKIMRIMGKKARLNEDENKMIIKYLTDPK